METVVDPFESERSSGLGGTAPGSLRDFILRDLEVRDIREVRLLERLISQGSLRQEDAETFLLDAKRRHRSMLEHAVDAGVATGDEILALSAELYNLPPVAIDQVEIDEGIATLLKAEQYRQYQALPYGRGRDGGLLVAIGDASRGEYVLSELGRLLPRERRLELHLAERERLATTIERVARSIPIAGSSEYSSATPEPRTLRAVDFSGNPTVALFSDLVTRAVVEGASDIHIEAGARESLIRFRVDGMLYDVMRLDPQMTTPLVALLKTRAEMLAHEKRRPQDGRFTQVVDGDRIDVRVVTIPIVGGEDLEQAVLRLQDPNRALLGLKELGMTEADHDRYLQGIQQPYGFLLVSGPTGSGKTTTLYASLSGILNPEIKVMSVEDPVELQLDGVMQIEVPRAGDDRWGFQDVLPSIVRSDPNIIMVGEIRDPETANLALNASLTGHYVYSTLHANNAVTTIVRLGELGVEPFLIAEALEMVVAQRLIRRVCDCGEVYEPTIEELKENRVPQDAVLRYEEGEALPTLRRASANGCSKCGGRGYRGRTGLFELLAVDDRIREAILRRADMLEIRQLAREGGMKTLREDGWIKVKSGVTTLQELNREIKRDVV